MPLQLLSSSLGKSCLYGFLVHCYPGTFVGHLVRVNINFNEIQFCSSSVITTVCVWPSHGCDGQVSTNAFWPYRVSLLLVTYIQAVQNVHSAPAQILIKTLLELIKK